MPRSTRTSTSAGRAGRILGIAAPLALAVVLLATLSGTAASVALPRASAPGQGAASEPVSYTHLTLPTNREV